MCLLFETIKIQNGTIQNIEFHNKRFNHTQTTLLGRSDYRALQDFIKIPAEYLDGIVKCKIVYAAEIDTIEYTRYDKKSIKTLKIVNCDDIDYSFKYSDRSGIDRLLTLKDGCDDIIIVKNNRMTDSSFCNLVFDDGNKLLTPVMPLLKGTKRDRLLSEGTIVQVEIGLKDLRRFKFVHLINAMLDLNECKIGIENIYP